MNANVTLNGVAEGLASEGRVVSLEEFADEPGGAWQKGWYPATIIEGYTTAKGKTFATEDSVSTKGDSRNLRVCLKVANGTNERTMQNSFNYRPSDFTAERLAFIKEAREEYRNVKGRWSDGDAQRSSLAIAKLGQVQKATLKSFIFDDHMDVTKLFNVPVDVYLSIDENGYNEVTAFAPAGAKTKRS